MDNTVAAIENSSIDTKKQSLHQISFLRMVASVGVCLFHFVTSDSRLLSASDPVRKSLAYGYRGVQIFFIISGFIICYSLPANYSIKQFFTFLKKRLIRVEPPYLLSIPIALLAAWFAFYHNHIPVNFSWLRLLFHIGYLNNFMMDGPNSYYNGVYWTLGIEFHFYIIIGLLFGLMKKSIYWLTIIIICFLASSYLTFADTSLIFEEFPFFCVGILMYFINYHKQYPQFILIGLLLASLVLIAINKSTFLPVTIFTIIIILIPFRKYKLVTFLSNISYSLYLTHVPIGQRIIHYLMRYANTTAQKYLLLTGTLAISIGLAYLFYIGIEKWAIKLSKKIRYSSAR
ncbi:acyltransferase [Mucilaginibacter sp. L196]|uniref:acyltransferase family protein n=1 Tax=Mucilaginibacter sp. L196 TaxID=1641870 RepID=UPI00131EB07D|nr:acyltransferase [Mucilaginibacter sp. L196]